jgi:MoaA/NifB/PqqE/SkfB family radical SAM enzyme
LIAAPAAGAHVERRLNWGPGMENTPAGSSPLPRLHRDRFGSVERRALLGFAAGALDADRPLMVNFVVTRRCNLSCGYCHEYDHTSAPVPFETLCARIDHLARLGVVLVAFTGGEALLHPRLADLVAHARARGMSASIMTNGFLLTADRIRAFNEAGLFAMQISVDAVRPNETTKKALRPLIPKLRLLAQHARFRVRVNTVFGAAPPREALEVARVAMQFGFDAKCALIRKGDGTLDALDAEARAVYEEIERLGGRRFEGLGEGFQGALLRDGQVDWKCRAGARFFHVCENGLVHLCAPRMGAPGTPLLAYTVEDIRRAFRERKGCAAHCPVAYAHQLSAVDRFRSQPHADGGHAPPTAAAPARKHLAVIA